MIHARLDVLKLIVETLLHQPGVTPDAVVPLTQEMINASTTEVDAAMSQPAPFADTSVGFAIEDPKPSHPGAVSVERIGLSFDRLMAVNRLRCEAHFHSLDQWKPWEWTNAMAGECGEACNVSKKMNRIWPANMFKQNWNKPEDQRMDELAERLADEVIALRVELSAHRFTEVPTHAR
jgi:hypothetical protein